MIQRIQTVYLLIASLCIALTFFFSFSTYTLFGTEIAFNASGFYPPEKFSIYPVFYSVGISLILAILSLFSFKKRNRQLSLNKLNYLSIITLIVFVFLNFNEIKTHFALDKESISYGVGMFLPIISLVCIFMANRAIKSDEKLIKSMDRIR